MEYSRRISLATALLDGALYLQHLALPRSALLPRGCLCHVCVEPRENTVPESQTFGERTAQIHCYINMGCIETFLRRSVDPNILVDAPPLHAGDTLLHSGNLVPPEFRNASQPIRTLERLFLLEPDWAYAAQLRPAENFRHHAIPEVFFAQSDVMERLDDGTVMHRLDGFGDAFLVACRTGRIATVSEFINVPGNLLSLGNSAAVSGFDLAVSFGRQEVVAMLISSHEFVNLYDPMASLRPFYLAVRFDSPAIFQFLLDHLRATLSATQVNIVAIIACHSSRISYLHRVILTRRLFSNFQHVANEGIRCALANDVANVQEIKLFYNSLFWRVVNRFYTAHPQREGEQRFTMRRWMGFIRNRIRVHSRHFR